MSNCNKLLKSLIPKLTQKNLFNNQILNSFEKKKKKESSKNEKCKKEANRIFIRDQNQQSPMKYINISTQFKDSNSFLIATPHISRHNKTDRFCHQKNISNISSKELSGQHQSISKVHKTQHNNRSQSWEKKASKKNASALNINKKSKRKASHSKSSIHQQKQYQKISKDFLTRIQSLNDCRISDKIQMRSYIQTLKQQINKFCYSLKSAKNKFINKFSNIIHKVEELFLKAIQQNCLLREIKSGREDLQKMKKQKQILSNQIEKLVSQNQGLIQRLELSKKNHNQFTDQRIELLTKENQKLLQVEMKQKQLLQTGEQRQQKLLDIISFMKNKGFDVQQIIQTMSSNSSISKQSNPSNDYEDSSKKYTEEKIEDKPQMRIRLDGIKGRNCKYQEFHQQFYSKLDEFSESWREQALKQRRY